MMERQSLLRPQEAAYPLSSSKAPIKVTGSL
jgi:hypothetical protein